MTECTHNPTARSNRVQFSHYCWYKGTCLHHLASLHSICKDRMQLRCQLGLASTPHSYATYSMFPACLQQTGQTLNACTIILWCHFKKDHNRDRIWMTMLYIIHLSSSLLWKGHESIQKWDENYPIIWFNAKKGHNKKILHNVNIRVHVERHETATHQSGQWRKEERRAEHALYAQGHADLHVQLILIEAGMLLLASKSVFIKCFRYFRISRLRDDPFQLTNAQLTHNYL